MVWLTGGALGLCVLMIVGMLWLVGMQGVATFKPRELVRWTTVDGGVLLGEVVEIERYRPNDAQLELLSEATRAAARERLAAQGGEAERRLVRTENFELTGTHYTWVSDFETRERTTPEWALSIERREGGPFYGVLRGFELDGRRIAGEPEAAWTLLEEQLPAVLERVDARRAIEREEIGRVNRAMEAERLAVRRAELEHGLDTAAARTARELFSARELGFKTEFERLRGEIEALDRQNSRCALRVEAADGSEQRIPLAAIVRTYPANRLDFGDRVSIYTSRTWEFSSGEPRESNTEGGVLPAIFGTVTMTLVMSILVVPFGVLAALYLREYAKPGPLVSFVRIAVNNLAGVPSIVFGVFGLGFFCYFVGASIDELFYAERLPSPTFGTGGVLWASLTLALLTLPVVIVPTEEALAAVPSSMREGSYACGATKWQTIRRIVLPRAMPGILTGMILAIARGAGEVAPLMLVGAVKLAPELPIDGEAPFVHPSRSFMHLGFHIYDLGFQSPNSEAAKPMVYTTTLLLIGLVVLLNVVAIAVRANLRRRFQGAQV
ncbi:MAG: phosphate ABC transporter permease PstA [Planctomycetes bacterium]|nr:phosphate ABC transporter permease PstA [Planctomycetota bacterium]